MVSSEHHSDRINNNVRYARRKNNGTDGHHDISRTWSGVGVCQFIEPSDRGHDPGPQPRNVGVVHNSYVVCALGDIGKRIELPIRRR